MTSTSFINDFLSATGIVMWIAVASVLTSGLIEGYDLVMLADDRHYFPPYDAVPIVRGAVLREHPEVGEALSHLAGRIDAAAMRRMNHAVDAGHRDAADVAREFLDMIK